MLFWMQVSTSVLKFKRYDLAINEDSYSNILGAKNETT
jgi:hypothetical protein